MKTVPGVVLMATMLFTTPQNVHALFGHVAAEKDRRQQVEQQLTQEQQRLAAQEHLTLEQQRLTSRWQTTASVLGIVAVLTLIAGTAIGSKARRDYES